MLKKKEKKNKLFIGGVIVLVVALLIIIPAFSTKIYETVSYGEFKELLNKDDFTFVYIGSPNCSHCKDMLPALNDLKTKYANLTINYLKLDDLTTAEKEDIKAMDNRLSTLNTPTFLFIRYGEIENVLVGATKTKEEFIVKFDEYYTEKTNYNIIDAATFVKLYKEKTTNVIVIGQSFCSHCTDYKPTINKVAKQYGVSINYIEFDVLTETDKETISKLDKKLETFGTPYTIITKKGKIIDELSGNVPMDQVVSILKNNGIIE